MEKELTEAEKIAIFNENLIKHDSNFTFDSKKLEEETEQSEYMEYIKWESKFTKQCKEIGYIQKSNTIQSEICPHCNLHGHAVLFETVGQLVKHLHKCKYTPANINKINNINFDCQFCYRVISNQHNKKIHEDLCKMNPKNTKKNEYNCIYCFKSMGNQYNLNMHQIKCNSNPEFKAQTERENMERIEKLKADHEKLTCRGCNRFLKHQMLYDLHVKQCKKYADYIVNEALKAENEYNNIDFDTITDIELQVLLKNTLQ